jgi:hypothetical protein
MDSSNSFLLMIILIVYAVIIFFGGVFIFRMYKKYNQSIFTMKKNGSYSEWKNNNKILLYFARLADYIIVFCLASFIIMSITKTSDNTGGLIYVLLPSLFLSIVLHLMLYFKLPTGQK